MEGATNGNGEGDNEMGESKDREMEERKGAGQKGEVRKEEEDLSRMKYRTRVAERTGWAEKGEGRR